MFNENNNKCEPCPENCLNCEINLTPESINMIKCLKCDSKSYFFSEVN